MLSLSIVCYNPVSFDIKVQDRLTTVRLIELVYLASEQFRPLSGRVLKFL